MPPACSPFAARGASFARSRDARCSTGCATTPNPAPETSPSSTAPTATPTSCHAGLCHGSCESTGGVNTENDDERLLEQSRPERVECAVLGFLGKVVVVLTLFVYTASTVLTSMPPCC